MKKKTVKLYDAKSHRYFNVNARDILSVFLDDPPKGKRQVDSRGCPIFEYWTCLKAGALIHYSGNKNPTPVSPVYYNFIQINRKSWIVCHNWLHYRTLETKLRLP